MSLLNLESADPAGKGGKKSLKVLLGIGGLSAVIAVASTLAANISINSGPVEFGQGVAQTAACDDQITVTPYSTFINDSSTGSHRLTSIKIGGIDSSEDKCAGKTFVIKAYGDSGLLDLFNWETGVYDPLSIGELDWMETERYNFVEIRNDVDEFTWTSGGTDNDDVLSETSTITDTSFTLNLVSASSLVRRNPLALSSAVTRITVETRDTVDEGPYAYCAALGGVAGSQSCQVISAATVDKSITIPTGFSLTFTGLFTITTRYGATITNNGTINSSGNVIINGVLINNGIVNNYNGEFNNGGGLFNNLNGKIYNYGIFPNNNQITNDGKIYNYGSLYVFHGITGFSPCIFENVGYLELVSVCP